MIALIASPLGRMLLLSVAALFLVAGAYLKGHHDGTVTERAAEAVAIAAELQRQAEAANAALDAARKRADAAEVEAADLQKQVDDYATELSKRGDSCPISGDDALRLQHIR